MLADDATIGWKLRRDEVLGDTTNLTKMKIYVGRQTKKLHGDMTVGDKV